MSSKSDDFGALSFANERADFFSELSRTIIEKSSNCIVEARAACSAWVNNKAPNMENRLGFDVEVGTLREIEGLFNGSLRELSGWREAQLRELAFWRWVAFEGYLGIPPEMFPMFQEHFMVSTYYRTGWSRKRFAQRSIFELGCGPLGMIEYVPGVHRAAYDPLNTHYARLFDRCRSSKIRYLSQIGELQDAESFDLVICHNVIDHTDDPAWWFNTLFDKLKDGGEFLFQVNLSRDDVSQKDEHIRMHPSPITREQITAWLDAKSDRYEISEAAAPSVDGEFSFLAWGSKTRNETIRYTNLVR